MFNLITAQMLLQLEQVCCEWLIKWVVKNKFGLAMHYELINYTVIPLGTGSEYGDTSLYLVVLIHYKLALISTWWYRVTIGLLCLYILKKSGDFVGWYRCVTHSLIDRQQIIKLLILSTVKSLSWVMQVIGQSSLYLAPHAIIFSMHDLNIFSAS